MCFTFSHCVPFATNYADSHRFVSQINKKIMLLIEEPEIFYSNKENFPLRDETYKIIGLAMDVHKVLGKGFLEIVYKDTLEIEFTDNLILYEREKPNH